MRTRTDRPQHDSRSPRADTLRGPARRSLLRLAAWVGAGALGLAAPHGGVYRGPGTAVGPGGATSGGPSSTSAGAPDTDDAAWSRWWSLNRDRYLALKDSVHRGGADTGGLEFFLGQGQRERRDATLRPDPTVIRERVIPALVHLLAKEKDLDIVTGTLLALGKIGEHDGAPSVVDAIRPYLAHKNQEAHEAAALALGISGEPAVAPLLASLMHDESAGRILVQRGSVPERTRAFAAYGLGLIGHRSERASVAAYVVHHLGRALRDKGSSLDLRTACVLTLGLVRVPDGASPELGSHESARPSRSRQAQITFLLQRFADVGPKGLDDRVRAYIPVALARLSFGARPDMKDIIARTLCPVVAPRSSEDKVVQQGVVHALALLGDADQDEADVRVRAALEDALAHGDRVSRNLALVSLARVAARPGSPPPAGALGQGPAGAVGAGDVREQVSSMLLASLVRGRTAERPWAALALGLLERESAELGPSSQVVRKTLRHAFQTRRSPSESGAYAIALGLAGDLEAAPDLTPRLRQGDENARGHVATGLGLMGAVAATGDLKAVVQGSSLRPGLIREAAIGLALLGDKSTGPGLLQGLESVSTMMDKAALAAALGYVGDKRVVEGLVQLTEDEREDDVTRAFGAVALGLICDKESEPWNAKLAADSGWWEAPPTLHDPGAGKGVLDIF